MSSKGWSKAWTEELERMIAAANLPYRVGFAWVEGGQSAWCAELVDRRTGNERRIRLEVAQFPTDVERKAEVLRQLAATGRTGGRN